jgi:hypothetical protein
MPPFVGAFFLRAAWTFRNSRTPVQLVFENLGIRFFARRDDSP